ncbi:MAG: biotin-dependent carboxyltransferase family protein [Proteobacteria bacterium]|nr:biotin-dependent carboxyltransferase family protein [Pseudomonadota bacterium]
MSADAAPLTPGLLVVEPGLGTSLQDLGRRHYQRFGISESGALDAPSLRLANALVGNASGVAALEITLSGPVIDIQAERVRLALVGADFPITLNGHELRSGRSFEARRGDRLVIGLARSGARAYLAVAGGFALEPTLGSLSTHSRSRLGGLDGGYLKAGDVLPLTPGAAGEGPQLALPALPATPAETLRVVLGPQDDFFTEAGIETFLNARYQVSPRADRMGYQFEGPVIAHAKGFNIVSDGIVNGSIQVPGNGQPIVLLADRQTTGGYPKIATVIEADLPILAQLRPGESIGFTAVTADEAEEIVLEARAALEARVAGLVEVGAARRPPAIRALLEADLTAGLALV